MVSAIIIDDEANNIINLETLLKKHCTEIAVVATAESADEGKELIGRLRPGLVFLDIQMTGKSGLQMLQELEQCDFEVIFVTAFDQYGIQAVKFAALDYLLKPIRVEDLKQAVEKAVRKDLHKKKNLQLENLLQLLQTSNQKNDHRLALAGSRETRFVQTRDIIRCESSNNYTHFYLKNGEKIIVSKPIYLYEELLKGYDFIRCHQSHLVNTQYVKSWIREQGDCLLLYDGTKIPVSRLKKDGVMAKLGYS